MNVTDRVFRRKVQAQYPEIASRIIEKPLLTDISKIENLYHIFSKIVGLPNKSKSLGVEDVRTLFIAVILKMYDPDYFNGYKRKVMDGLRTEVAKLFDVGVNYVSDMFSLAVGRIKIYKDMEKSVDMIFEMMKEEIKRG